MRILAIDPGPVESAWVHYDSDEHRVVGCGIEGNEQRLSALRFNMGCDLLAIEMIASYGMAVGKSVFDTCVWIGRFVQAWVPRPWHYVYRLDVKMVLCHDSRAKDANIRQAIIDCFPATGGGACPQVGTKKQPGPLYGISKDMWSALAVALTVAEKT